MAGISQRTFPHGLSGLGSLSLESMDSLRKPRSLKLLTDSHEDTHTCVFLGRGPTISVLVTKVPEPPK